MKKTLFTGLVILAAFFSGHCQQTNDNNDDVYYQGDDDQQSTDQTNPDDQNSADNSDNSTPTYQTFYDQLSPYGSWMNYPPYGYVWVPSGLGPDFSPYATNGHWVYTDLGWTWVSDFDWGWGPFHYGRWFEDPSYGWIWVPGYDWAPAWVIWGDYGGYYGWACVGPGVVLTPHYRPDSRYWHFVDHGHLGDRDFHNYLHRPEEVYHGDMKDFNNHINVVSHANTYHQSVFFSGPRSSEVEKYSGQKIATVRVNNSSRPGASGVQGNQLNIYRPNVTRTQTPHGAPTKVTRTEDVRPANRPQQTPAQRNAPAQRTEPAQRNNPAPAQQRTQQSWTPPRQPNPTPAPRENQPQRTFVPTERSAPAAQPHYSAPSAPRGGGGFGGGGGGASHGGGGRR